MPLPTHTAPLRPAPLPPKPAATAYPAHRPTPPEEAARCHVARSDRPPGRIAPPFRALVYDVLVRAEDAGGNAPTPTDARLRERARALLDDESATEYDFRAWLVALRRQVRATGRDLAFAPGSPARALWTRVLATTGSPRRDHHRRPFAAGEGTPACSRRP